MRRVNTARWIESKKMWRIDVQKDGVRKSFYCSTPGRNGQREANRKADAWLESDIISFSVRTNALLDEYLERVKATTSKSNYRKESYHVEHFIRPVMGRKKACHLTDLDCQKVIDSAFRRTGKDGKTVELSRKTLMNIRATLAAFAKFCRKRRVVLLNSEDWEIPKGSRYKGKSILQPDSLIKLFSTDTTLFRGKRVKDPFIHAYRFQVLTGVRPGELCGLHPEDCQPGKVIIRRSINVDGEETSGKNENAIRSVVLSPLAEAELTSQLRDLPGDGTVFGLRSESYYRKRWTVFCDANDISYVSRYELRHTFVSVVKNLPEGEVKALVGHSRNMDTFGTYGHELDGEQNQVAIRVNSLFLELLKRRGKG